MAGGRYFNGVGNAAWGSEGIFQEYSFYTGNKYYLKLKVEGKHGSDGADNTVDRVFIALTNGLVAKEDDDQPGDYILPSVQRQVIWESRNFNTGNAWQDVEIEFVPTADYSQLWFSLEDDDGDADLLRFAHFSVAEIVSSCCPETRYVQATDNLPTSVQATDHVGTMGAVSIVPGQDIMFSSGNTITLTTGFHAAAGSLFTAKLDAYCDCSPGGGNVSDMCAVYSGNIAYIANPTGTGVFVPNYFNRNVNQFWFPTSFGYDKPYNAYEYNLKIINRNGTVVEQQHGWVGVEGFTNNGIKWDGGDVSTGSYFVELDLINCSGTKTYKDWLQVDGSPHTFARAKESELAADVLPKNDVIGSLLHEAFPNPASDEITISYEIKRNGPVAIKVLNVTGDYESQVLVNGDHPAGRYMLKQPLEHFPAGLYLLSLQTAEARQLKKFIVIK